MMPISYVICNSTAFLARSIKDSEYLGTLHSTYE